MTSSLVATFSGLILLERCKKGINRHQLGGLGKAYELVQEASGGLVEKLLQRMNLCWRYLVEALLQYMKLCRRHLGWGGGECNFFSKQKSVTFSVGIR